MSEATFADSESDDEYQSLSVLALLALLASFATPLALLTPLLWFLPIIPIVLGLFAISTIRRRPDSLTGSQIAIAAIVIGAFFLALAPARSAARRIWLRTEAKQHADSWLELVQAGKIAESYNLTLSPDRRSTNIETINTRFGKREDDGKLPEAVDALFAAEPLGTITSAGSAEIKFVAHGVYHFYPANQTEEFTLHYEVALPSQRLPIQLNMRREMFGDSAKPVWTVGGVREDSDDRQ